MMMVCGGEFRGSTLEDARRSNERNSEIRQCGTAGTCGAAAPPRRAAPAAAARGLASIPGPALRQVRVTSPVSDRATRRTAPWAAAERLGRPRPAPRRACGGGLAGRPRRRRRICWRQRFAGQARTACKRGRRDRGQRIARVTRGGAPRYAPRTGRVQWRPRPRAVTTVLYGLQSRWYGLRWCWCAGCTLTLLSVHHRIYLSGLMKT